MNTLRKGMPGMSQGNAALGSSGGGHSRPALTEPSPMRGIGVRRSFAVVTVLAMSMFGVTYAGPSAAAGAEAATPVVCGATITADTTLHRDLVDCADNGLVIGADNVTLNLNGHTIDGNESLVDPCPESCDVGVDNTAGHAGLIIKGGSIEGFAVGVLVIGADANQLRHLAVSRNFYSGVIIADSTDSLVQGCSVTENGLTTDQAGMDLFTSHGIVIRGNTISRNGDIGIQAGGAGDRNRIVNNVISDNPEAGIGLDGTANVLSGNRVQRNGDGIDVGGDDNVVTGNLVTDAVGCPDGCGYGISFEGGANNLIADNVVARARVAGIRVDAYGGFAIGTVVRGNLVRAAGVDGIAINPDQVGPVTDTLLSRNVTLGAGDDGIDVQSPSTALSRNIANSNGDLGIEAVPGVHDSGGNHANNNNNPLQCINVDC